MYDLNLSRARESLGTGNFKNVDYTYYLPFLTLLSSLLHYPDIAI